MIQTNQSSKSIAKLTLKLSGKIHLGKVVKMLLDFYLKPNLTYICKFLLRKIKSFDKLSWFQVSPSDDTDFCLFLQL